MKHKKEIYKKMKRTDFGESMSDETKLKVLNFVERQLRLCDVVPSGCYLMKIDGKNTIVMAENIASAMDKADKVGKEYEMINHSSWDIIH